MISRIKSWLRGKPTWTPEPIPQFQFRSSPPFIRQAVHVILLEDRTLRLAQHNLAISNAGLGGLHLGVMLAGEDEDRPRIIAASTPPCPSGETFPHRYESGKCPGGIRRTWAGTLTLEV